MKGEQNHWNQQEPLLRERNVLRHGGSVPRADDDDQLGRPCASLRFGRFLQG